MSSHGGPSSPNSHSNANAHSNEGGGVRRRHSHHDDDDDAGFLQSLAVADEQQSQNATAQTHDPFATQSSALEGPSLSRLSVDGPHRVRFSTDLERPHVGQRPRPGTATTVMEGGGSQWGPSEGRGGRGSQFEGKGKSGSAGLTVVTREIPAPDGSSSSEHPPASSSAYSSRGSARSPLSPTSRNRGYSLRSALFRKNVTGQPQSPGEIELQDRPRSSRAAGYAQMDDIKEANVSVAASPISRDFAQSTSKKQLGKGPIALPNYNSWLESHGSRRGYVKRAREYANKARKFLLRIKEIPPSKDGRHIHLDTDRDKALLDERTNQPYMTNWIRSTRYSAWNFVPRQLIAQFSKLANFYFLCISVLQMIPGLSTTGTYTTIIPLMFFVMLSIAKEGYDDLRRYRLDKAENNRMAKVLRKGQGRRKSARGLSVGSDPLSDLDWEDVKWQDIQVGNVVKLGRNDAAPADVALLHTNGDNSIAYVETMALDGETNLKSKQTTASLSKAIKSPDDLVGCPAEFVVEDPNQDLYSFEGRVTLDGKTAPLTLNEIIFRGSILRNTPDAIGLVIYSGEECRIRMNANKNPRIKAPALQALVNRIVILIVVFVLALAIFNTVAYRIWRSNERSAFYLKGSSVAFFPNLTSFIIMFNTMIPLSLYVSLEIVKLAQMGFMHADIDMYDPVSQTPCEPRTSTINEELGQISYIFSDKTGTLTDNSMKFRKISVGGASWLHDADLQDEQGTKLKHKRRKKGKQPVRKSVRSVKDVQTPVESSAPAMEAGDGLDEFGEEALSTKWKSSARPGRSQQQFVTQDMLRYMQKRPHSAFSKRARMFLLSLALCHTCLPELQEDGSTQFMASSPDELALVQAAQDMGFLLINRDVHTITISIRAAGDELDSVHETYEILDVVEFSSKRKRMSIVVRFPDGRICIICKGADSIVMQRLRLATLANKNMVEIEKRASRRKSLEASYAIARMSEQLDRSNSFAGRRSSTIAQAARASFSLGRASMSRPSVSGQGRPSIGRTSHLPGRNEVDQWLRERESDYEIDSLGDATEGQTPRPSGLGRLSMAVSEARSSMQLNDMEDMVDENVAADEPAVIERCLQHINDFATEGLRTLLYGYRFLTEDEYATWKKGYLDATTSLVDRARLIEQSGDLIEQDLELCAATAIEDKLQKGVPEAIDKLRRAKIKMWMLTGDKRETAINIGHSCRLIKDYSCVTVLDHESGEVEQHIGAAVLGINRGGVAHSVVVVDGPTLARISDVEPLKVLFYDLAILADSVICCRASPAQKAALVRGIRKRVRKSITLAIGDGANDIAMIQEAHVGIGITGKEGLQAARTSDYSIAQFRFLTKLLLVHGRWNYVRTCKYTVGTFWKEMLFYLTQALFQRSAGYTGTSLYESWSLSMFNTLFTSLPVIFMGIFERDLAASTLLAVPELYVKGQRNGGFNFAVYLWWMFLASAEAMVVYFAMLGLYGQALFTEDNSIFALGSCTFTACVVVIAGKMQFIETHSKTMTNALAIFCSVGGWFLWNIILSATYKPESKIYYVRDAFFDSFGRSWTWWLTLILILTSVFSVEVAAATLLATFLPTDTTTFQVLESDPSVKRRFEEAAAEELQMGWTKEHGDLGGETKVDDEADAGAEEGAKETGFFARRKQRKVEAETRLRAMREERERKREEEVGEMLRRRVEG